MMTSCFNATLNAEPNFYCFCEDVQASAVTALLCEFAVLHAGCSVKLRFQQQPRLHVKVGAPEMIISSNSQDADRSTIHVQQGGVKRPSTNVIHQDIANSRALVQVVSHSSCSRLLEYSSNLESSLFKSFLCCLRLRIGELGWNTNHYIADSET
mmetsp:Transcript_81405/g.143719  ORF Transcript_81405/g.143719 Transcript_81405/m.143719 type:complete len:154 (-) Transcript_81405:600-1061(-)